MKICIQVNSLDGINILRIQLWDSILEHLTISSPPKKDVQSPKAFIFFTTHWMKPMFGYYNMHIMQRSASKQIILLYLTKTDKGDP